MTHLKAIRSHGVKCIEQWVSLSDIIGVHIVYYVLEHRALSNSESVRMV